LQAPPPLGSDTAWLHAKKGSLLNKPFITRRSFQQLALSGLLAGCSGCIAAGSPGELNGRIWSRRGISDGRLQKPRALAIDAQDQLLIVDMTGRIQVFTTAGDFIRGWSMPKIDTGRPVGLGIHQDGSLMVADTHNFRILFFTPAGELQPDRTIGGTFGHAHGEFGLVTDIVQDSHGDYYISEYGDNDRIQKFTGSGEFVYQIGSHGSDDEQFLRPQSLQMDDQDQLYVADSCNHRIFVIDVSGVEPVFVKHFGQQGTAAGELRYPYGIALDGKGSIYVCEFGNHRVQQFGVDGTPIRHFGVHGRRGLGEFQQPWALEFDSTGVLHVLDSYNHRVQSFKV
jgi:sugar lactone lactonase YvrE